MLQVLEQQHVAMDFLFRHLWWTSRREKGMSICDTFLRWGKLTWSDRQINMDYSICKALSYNMEDIPVALVMYDIMCQYRVNFMDRVAKSPELILPSTLELRTGIGLFHIHGHQDSCLPRYSPSFIPEQNRSMEKSLKHCGPL
jgi:hypothetical protein